MSMHERIIPYLERAVVSSGWMSLWLVRSLRGGASRHTFHMPFGEYTVTLQDVAFQLGLPVDGKAVSGCLADELPPPNKVKQMTVHFTWFHERFRMLPVDATEDTVCIYARAYIMMLLSTQLFGDKSANRLPFVMNLEDMGSYSWGSAALA
ncbi:hypothetical protein Ahy_B09g099998 [Arachis hypogaea]|uniref:Aminotransferase-like plant mobile domain-containing protein n=1 Tax=Arachis hypogaea TaxID=3818 RepID=A0A444XWH6_ARAHY|nr:hypothetical protein Ahy_B09g099998 [Arachis hypogaea]